MNIELHELATPEGAMRFAFALAEHWGVLTIPAGTQILVTGIVVVNDQTVDPGMALLGPRAEGAPGLVVADGRFVDSSAAGCADAVITRARQAL